MSDAVTAAMLLMLGTIVAAILAAAVKLALSARNNRHNRHNTFSCQVPADFLEKLWDEHKTLEAEIKITRGVMRDGFTALEKNLGDRQRDIVGVIENMKRDVVDAINRSN